MATPFVNCVHWLPLPGEPLGGGCQQGYFNARPRVDDCNRCRHFALPGEIDADVERRRAKSGGCCGAPAKNE